MAHVENHWFPPQDQPGRLCSCLQMANARKVTVLFQAEIFRFLLKCTFLKINKVPVSACVYVSLLNFITQEQKSTLN